MTHNPYRAGGLRALAAAATGVGLMATSLAPAVLAAPNPTPSTAAMPGVVSASGDAGVQESFESGRYFVILKGQPSVTYRGGVDGMAATAASKDGGFQAESAAVAKYEQYLSARQDAVASSVGVQPDMKFSRALNAFVADLTPEQALSLSRDEQVLAVSKDEELKPDYSSTEFLGLPGANGTWNNTYGGAAQAGKGMVVGVIDSGIHPDNPFIDGKPVQALQGEAKVGVPYKTDDGRTAMLKADGTTAYADCQTGPDFPASSCDDKLLGAYAFSKDFEAFVPVDKRDPSERISPLGVKSHGTHTATTIVGNAGTKQTIAGQDFGTGSGVAPASKLIAYKVCWEDTDPDTGGCYTSASVAAVEQAIANNVDVINYSISGSNTSIVDPVALAFRSAAEAGIFVAASAGNSGPAANTVNHSSPWVTSVAAETFSNELASTVQFSDGTSFRGASAARTGVGPAEVVHATEVAAAGVSADSARLCLPGSLDPAKTAGKIVLCERGQNARTEKSEVVKAAGGVGMILVNTPTGSLDADFHAVPTVHMNDDGIIQKVKSSDLTATIVPGDTTGLPQDPLPQIAGFSSRGPSNAVNQEFLKPDVAAPGVNVLAGVSPLDSSYHGDQFGLMSGTSMASPNLAGMATLLGAKHPDWSPMAVKSALMTTAGEVYNADGSANTDNFATGAGSADPAAASAPGLVYESDARQWDAMLLGDISARDVNVPSLVIPDLVGSTTVKRTVTAKQAGTWTFQAKVPGYSITASPSTVSLAAGESAEVTLTVTRTDAATGEWQHGSMSWRRPAGQSVTSPVTLKSVTAQADSHVEGQGASGSTTVEVAGGMTGELDPSIAGLAPVDSQKITGKPGSNVSVVGNQSSIVKEIIVGEGATALDVAVNAGSDKADWDLYVMTPNFKTISAATAEGSEALTIPNPAPGKYYVISHLFADPDGSDTADFESLVLKGDAGNMTVSPDPLPIVSGKTREAEVKWNGLTQGTWRGLITWAPGITTTVTVRVGEGTGPVDPGTGTCDVADFADVPGSSRFYSAVNWMRCEGITTGYADNTYRPQKDISRGESMAFLYRYLKPEHTAPSTSPFADVAAGSTFYDAITWAEANGVTTGYADDTFRPGKMVTRGEFASFVYRAVGDKDYQPPAKSPFKDVAPNQTHYKAIMWLRDQGVVLGKADGTYGVSDEIIRGDVAVIMERLDGVLND